MRTFVTTAALLVAIVLIYSADAQTVTIKTADCASFVSHIPTTDVAYKPGVDVHGRPVAPARRYSTTSSEASCCFRNTQS